MEYIRVNNLNVRGNVFSFATMRFHIKITPVVTIDRTIVAWEEISKDVNSSIGFNFDNIEDAISFAQNEVNKSTSFEEINDKYTEFTKGRQKTISHP